MGTRDNRAEYDRRMHRVVEAIDRQLDQPLNLEMLAAVAHFSPFHFHRLFTAWHGETPADYLRRRRVEVAATRLLAQPRVPVLQIALAVGFGSAEAFARAFKLRFGCSASAWRAQIAGGAATKRKIDQVNRKIDQAQQSIDGHNKASYTYLEAHMKVNIIERPATHVACLRYTGEHGAPISLFWQNTVVPWLATHNLFGRPRYGISHDNPRFTAAEKCRYDACVEVPEDFVASGDTFMTTIPGGKYAALQFKGTVAELGDAWAVMLRDWLPGSGLQIDARPLFEHYPVDATFNPETGVFNCEICVPVAPLK